MKGNSMRIIDTKFYDDVKYVEQVYKIKLDKPILFEYTEKSHMKLIPESDIDHLYKFGAIVRHPFLKVLVYFSQEDFGKIFSNKESDEYKYFNILLDEINLRISKNNIDELPEILSANSLL